MNEIHQQVAVKGVVVEENHVCDDDVCKHGCDA